LADEIFIFKFAGPEVMNMNIVFHFLRKNASLLLLWMFIPVITIINFNHHHWVHPEKVIQWDVKSYYAYLPAVFIYKDLSLEFRKQDPAKFSELIWPVKTPTGKYSIITSMGMSIMYLPFFLIGHAVAWLTPYEADGYTVPYAFCLTFSVAFYILLGLICLRKLLRKFFNEGTVFIVLILIFAGTNLLYYSSWEAAMSHGYNFGFISVFLWLNYKWHLRPAVGLTILIGSLTGLIVLIRPTNIMILLILLLWNVYSWHTFVEKIQFLFRNYLLLLLMAFCFILVWTPQFLYWKYISGKFLYFSYAGIGGTFFWTNPQIKDILFSFRKGWFVYTPLMLFAVAGIFILWRKYRFAFWPVLVFLLVNIYVQSSWWSWWFGGSYGNRAFIDSYGLMAIPLAATVSEFLKWKWKGVLPILILFTVAWYNTFQVRQYKSGALHYCWMSYDAYRETFLKKSPTTRVWKLIPYPDYPKARKGIYVADYLIERYQGEYQITPQMIVNEIKGSLSSKDIKRGLLKRGRELHLTNDSLLTITAWNIYETRFNLSEYIKPIEDSLRRVNPVPADSLNPNP